VAKRRPTGPGLPRHARRHRLAHHDDQRPRRARLGRRRHRGRGRDARPAVSMLIPQVVGFKLTGKLPEGAPRPTSCSPSRRCCARRASSASSSSSSARPRRRCRSPTARRSPTWRPSTARPAASSRSTTRRSTTCASPAATPSRSRSSRPMQGAGLLATTRRPTRSTPTRSSSTSATVEPSPRRPEAPAGPRAARDMKAAVVRQASCRQGLAFGKTRRGPGQPAGGRTAGARRDAKLEHGASSSRHRGDHELHQHLEPERDDRRRPRREEGRREGPDAQAVGEDLARAGLEGRHRLPRQGRPHPDLEALGFHSSATAARPASATRARCPTRSAAINDGDLVAAACSRATATSRAACTPTCARTTSPRRRWSSPTRSPARHRHRPRRTEPLGTGKDGKPVFLKDIWPTTQEVADRRARVTREHVHEAATATCSPATRAGRRSRCPAGETYAWDAVDLRPAAAVLRRACPMEPAARQPTSSARACWPCSATRSPPTTSRRPATSRPTAPPASTCSRERRAAGRLQLLRRAPRQPRGDDARHLRQHPHQEQDAPGVEGG
jgi:hypothetical protein